MNKTLVNPSTLAKPSGFTHGVLTEGGRLLFLAGQTGMNASGPIESHVPQIVRQFRQALANLNEVVAGAGGQMTDIVQMAVYVTDKAQYQAHLTEIGEVYQSFFGRYYPAMALVEIKSLWDAQALVEIAGVAVIGEA